MEAHSQSTSSRNAVMGPSNWLEHGLASHLTVICHGNRQKNGNTGIERETCVFLSQERKEGRKEKNEKIAASYDLECPSPVSSFGP